MKGEIVRNLYGAKKSDSIQLWQENNHPRQRKNQNIPDTTNPPSTDKASRYWIHPERNLA